MGCIRRSTTHCLLDKDREGKATTRASRLVVDMIQLDLGWVGIHGVLGWEAVRRIRSAGSVMETFYDFND